MRSPSKKLFVALCAVAALAVGLIGTAAAQGPGGNPLDQILNLLRDPDIGLAEIKSEVRTIEENVEAIQEGLTALSDDVASIAEAVEGLQTAQYLKLSVEVDEQACDSVPLLCGGGDTGHTGDPAADTNHNPVRAVVLVTLNGEPVEGLSADNFSVRTPFLPAGGTALAICPEGGTGCALGFRSSQGMYELVLHPAPEGSNWRAGSYFTQITVTTDEGLTGTELLEIVIPQG